MFRQTLHIWSPSRFPIKDDVISAQGCKWEVFKELAEKLNKRELTGHAARDAHPGDEFRNPEQWNGS